MNYYTIGIDPGFTGAISILKVNTQRIELFYLEMMPLKVSSDRKQIDAKYIFHLLKDLAPTHPPTRSKPSKSHAIVEDVSAMPTDAPAAAFKFGYGAGVLQGVLSSLSIPIIPVKPAVWKSALSLSPDKADSVKLANELFGTHSTKFTLKTEAMAEATLMAYFGAKRLLPAHIFSTHKNLL